MARKKTGKKEDGEEEEEGDEGLLGMDVESEGEEEEEVDDDALGGEVPRGPGYDQFGHMLGSGSPATQARRMELAGQFPFPLLLMSQGMQYEYFTGVFILACSCLLTV